MKSKVTNVNLPFCSRHCPTMDEYHAFCLSDLENYKHYCGCSTQHLLRYKSWRGFSPIEIHCGLQERIFRFRPDYNLRFKAFDRRYQLWFSTPIVKPGYQFELIFD